jgi:Type I phosphodiesterase / nucleotide pyrophosphatase
MTRRLRWKPVTTAALALVLTLALAGSGTAQQGQGGKLPKPPGPPTEKAILFAADGMRPDLVDRYAARGLLPTLRDLMRKGVKGRNGLLQAFPPNTGVGWHSLATGAWPSVHGSTNNTFHRTGESNFNDSASFATPGILQADHIGQASERAGKTVVSVEWVASRAGSPRPSKAPWSTSGRSSAAAASS